MKPLLGLLAVASSMAAVLTSGTPASAQYYSPYRSSSPSYSFTPSQSNTRYNVYQPQRSYSSGYGSSFGQSRRSTQGFGHSSGSYFGW